jgi:fibronectin type 3 domain-containing protein
MKLTATVRDSAGRRVADPVLVWASTDSAVASVDATGLVTALDVGTATITATSGGETGRAAITVGSDFVAADSLAVLDSTRILLLSDSAERASGTYRFQRISGPMPDWDTVAVIIGAQGPGFLRRVEQVSVSGDVATVETSDADLSEAIEVGRFATTSRVFDDSAANQQGNIFWGPTQVLEVADGVQAIGAGRGVDLSGVKLAFMTPGSTAQVEVSFTIEEGAISFPVIMDLDADFSFLQGLTKFRALFGGGVQFDIEKYAIAVTGSLAASKDSVIQKKLIKFSKRFVTFAGYIPVSGELILSFKAEAELKASAAVELTGDFHTGFEVRAGAEWRRGSGWRDLSGSSRNFSASPLDLAIKGSVEAKVAVVPELFLRMYDVAGPFVNIEPYLKAAADMTAPAYDWRAGIDHGIDLNIGFKIQIMDKKLASFAKTVPLYVIPILEAFSDGPLRVADSTTGSDLPPGYRTRVRPDWDVRNALLGRDHSTSYRDSSFARGSPILLDDVRSGDAFPHITSLVRVQGNCTPGAYHIPRGVVSGFSHSALGIGGVKDTTEAKFFVFCIPFGAIRAGVVTSGPDQDPDGYDIRFERIDTTGSSPKWFDDDREPPPAPNLALPIPIGVTDSVLLDSLIPLNPRPPGNGATGAYRLRIGDVQKNCAVARPMDRSVISNSGDTVQARFQVQCIHLGAVMSRSTLLDPDPVSGSPVRHEVTVAEAVLGSSAMTRDTLVASDSAVAGGLFPLYSASGADGRHLADLVPLANRCSPGGGSARPVTVLSADTTVADYPVSCVERFHLRNVTTGNGPPDPDGYQIVIDGTRTIDVATNVTVGVAGLAPGSHTLAYTGLASNCGLQSGPASAAVPVHDSTLVVFSVACGTFTAPSGLSGTVLGSTSVRLDWIAGADPVHGVTHHRIYRDGVVFDSVAMPLETWRDTTLTPNETREYSVTAVNGQGTESVATSVVRLTTLALAPTGLVASARSSSEIDLAWAFVTGIPGYRVYRDGVVQPGVVADTTFIDGSLNPATRYRYHVTALNDASVESAASDTVSAVTDPVTPTGLQAQTTSRAVSLAWDSGGPEVVVYLVTRDGASWDSTVAPTFTDTVVASNTSYQYAVEARTSVGVLSGPSAPLTATTRPDAPDSLTATTVSDTRIDLAWTAPSGQVTGYRVRRAGLDTVVTTTGFGDTGLTGSTTYGYLVSAFGVTGLEGPADSASATTLPPTTGGLEVITQTSGAATSAYTVVIEGSGARHSRAIGPNDSVLFSALTPGTYEVILRDLPSTCTVSSANPQSATVQVGSVTQAVFVLTCSATVSQ